MSKDNIVRHDKIECPKCPYTEAKLSTEDATGHYSINCPVCGFGVVSTPLTSADTDIKEAMAQAEKMVSDWIDDAGDVLLEMSDVELSVVEEYGGQRMAIAIEAGWRRDQP